MNLARFKITGSTSGASPSTDGGFDAVSGETLTLELETSSAVVFRATYEVPDAALQNAPLASKDATELVLGGSGTTADASPSPQSPVVVAALPAEVSSWTIRCVVDGGVNPATGRLDPDFTFERVVAIRTSGGARKEILDEGSKYGPRGRADAQNELLDMLEAIPPGGSDATAIRGIPVDAAVGSAGAGQDGYALTYNHGAGEFLLAPGGSGGGLTAPTTPGEDELVAVAFGGDLTYTLLVDAHIDNAAGISVSKLESGPPGTVLGPAGYTATPSVTSLSASSHAALGDGTLASAGAVRLDAGGKLAWRNAGNDANNTIGWSSDVWEVHVGVTKALSVGASTVAIEAAATLGFAAGITSPTITQAEAADAAGQNLSVRAQGNNSAASAAGNLVLGGGVNAGAGADGVTRVMYGAARVAEFGADYLGLGTAPGSGTTAHAATGPLRLPRMNPSGGVLVMRNNADTDDQNLIVVSSGANAAFFGGSFGVVGLQISNVTRVQVTATETQFVPPIIQFTSAVVAPTIRQVVDATATVTGDEFTIQAQDCSGTTAVTGGKMTIRSGDATGGSGTRNGGAMLLRAGRGATLDGNIGIHADPASWNGMGRGLFVGNRSAAPTGNPADGGYLYAESGELWWRSSAGVSTQLT